MFKVLPSFLQSISPDSISITDEINAVSDYVSFIIFALIAINLLLGVSFYLVIANKKRQNSALLGTINFINDLIGCQSDPDSKIEKNLRGLKEAARLHFTKIKEFIKAISSGDYNGNTFSKEILKSDNLLKHLFEMREELQTINNENAKTLWATNGFADISELIRNNADDIDRLGESSIRLLVKILKYQGGALFVVAADTEELTFQVKGSFGSESAEIGKRINLHSGILGQAYNDGCASVMTKIPAGYFKISTGLGDAAPDSLVVVPCIYNQKVEAILELVTFGAVPEHHVAFLNKAGEYLAAAIQSLRMKNVTDKLLIEARENENRLNAHRREMEQAIHELTTSQEYIKKREREIEAKFNELHESYGEKIKIIEEREKDLLFRKSQMEKALNIDGLIVDVAGRNRYVSQRIALLCGLVYKGRIEFKEELKSLVEVHDDAIIKIKLGGIPSSCEKNISIPPAAPKLFSIADKVHLFWNEYRSHLDNIISENANDSVESDNSISFIESNAEKMLRLNNELVQACIRAQGREISNDTYPLYEVTAK